MWASWLVMETRELHHFVWLQCFLSSPAEDHSRSRTSTTPPTPTLTTGHGTPPPWTSLSSCIRTLAMSPLFLASLQLSTVESEPWGTERWGFLNNKLRKLHHLSPRISVLFLPNPILFLIIILSQVSWLRHADTHLLTAGRYTYTSDERFRAKHKVNYNNGL